MQPFEAIRRWKRREERNVTIDDYPSYHHLEKHFNAAEVVKDIILGLSGKRRCARAIDKKGEMHFNLLLWFSLGN
jgi:hypothetical protein